MGILLLALLFHPTAAATTVESDIAYASVEVVGISTIPATAAYLFIPPAAEGKQVSFTMRAERLVVNWTEIARYDVMDPTNMSRPYGGIQQGPPSQGERDHRNATASASIIDPAANLLFAGPSQKPLTMSLDCQSLRVDSNPSDHWMVGAHSRGADPTPIPNGSTVRVPLPPEFVRARVHDAQIVLTGDTLIYVWQANVEVVDSTGTTTYASGTVHETQNPTPGPLPVGERQTRLLTIRASNATLAIRVVEGEAVVVGEAFGFASQGLASFASVSGVVGGRPLFDDKITVEGKFAFKVNKSSSAGDRLTGALAYDPALARVFASGLEITSPVPTPPFPWTTTWWILGAVSFVTAGGVGARRLRPVRVDEVELALLAGRQRRAYSLARRLAQRRPGDPEAVFLYATTLMQRAEFARLLDKIEPLATGIKQADRGGIAFLLALAAHALGDKPRSARWATEAARDPQLAKKLAESGIAGPITPGSASLQSGYA